MPLRRRPALGFGRDDADWLRKHGFEYPALFVVSTSRGKIASSLELDVVVDDRPRRHVVAPRRHRSPRRLTIATAPPPVSAVAPSAAPHSSKATRRAAQQ